MAKQVTLHIIHGPALKLFGGGAATDAAGDPPNRLVVCPWGESETDDGKIYVNATTIRNMSALNVHPWDRIPLDFEHSTEDPKIPHPKPIAAYGNPKCIPGEGIVYEDLKWTPDGITAWHAKSYPDLSPAISLNKKNEVVFCKSAALTTNGRVKQLHLYSALTLPDTTSTTDTMDFKKILISLLVAQGATLADDASDEAVAAAAQSLADGKKGSETTTATMSAGNEALLKRLEKIELFAAQQGVDAINHRKAVAVQAATAEGKVIQFSAEEIKDIPEAVLLSHIAKLPPGQVNTQSRMAGVQPGTDINLSVDGEEAAALKLMSAQLGLSAEDLKTFGGVK